ncbi:Regulatory protein Spx [Lentilactobacillus parabuchneri]|nr:Spx/MgsR family RNA polymerase-binding regulatory protein [Lentilactobacillus parabuchneri]APR06852.1 Regulatory protein Spx [Lentilactobacillus parabuchneri]MBW0222535.1 Spx/MgsR family RNA polymerase-binding regulatory protein [Lentilactobacillus parabuchneri]MBW0245877.1 Spx/MgsR family RNA polymerase-binding regulatory protein [Lentilactobacillus parabuchneri]MBW0264440.1 Spx/MgsR family RNA polymerase-binding regulatory protein [Lentilactobacillus parabuchneri]MCT2884721.1 Spx/MgsR fam
MLNLYLAPSSSSSRRAKKWLIDHGIEFTERDISKDPLTADDIKRLLRLSENGTEDLISTRCISYRKLKVNFDNLTVSQLIDLMVNHTDLIRRPLIFNDQQLQVGFSEENIRSFLPRHARKELLDDMLAHADAVETV